MNNETTTEQVDNKIVPNPKGVGGFGDNPQNINAGGRPKNQESFTYWLNYFKGLSISEFFAWIKDNEEDARSVASDLAYIRVLKARNDLREFEVVANRTEGMPKHSLELDGTVEHKLTYQEVVKLIDDTTRSSEDADTGEE